MSARATALTLSAAVAALGAASAPAAAEQSVPKIRCRHSVPKRLDMAHALKHGVPVNWTCDGGPTRIDTLLGLMGKPDRDHLLRHPGGAVGIMSYTPPRFVPRAGSGVHRARFSREMRSFLPRYPRVRISVLLGMPVPEHPERFRSVDGGRRTLLVR
jgi:hypothetical protein